MSDIALNLFDPLLVGNGHLGNYIEPFKSTWRRSIARQCGFKIGTVDLTAKELTPGEMGDFFRYGLMREIREMGGGLLSWQGIVAAMEWQHKGDVFWIDINTMFNARRALYRRLFDNLLTNGSAESGAWTAYNGATVTQSTEWVADGTYSCKIVVPDAIKRGAMISQASITISAQTGYQFTGRMNIVSGSWSIEARRIDTDARLARYETAGQTGNLIASLAIPATNDYAGNIYLRVTTINEAGAGTCYVDAATFKPNDQPADTGWKQDTASIAVYGRKEWIDLWGGLSGEAANARVTSDLLLSSWPQPDVLANGGTRQIAVDPREDKLKIMFAGYWTTLNWLYTRFIGSDTASNLVRTLAGYQTDYIRLGSIETNTMPCTIEDSNPLRIGDVLKEICDSGEESGGLWSIGVYADRWLEYARIAPELSYHLRGGRLLQVAGGDMEPWLARPGWAQVDDLPNGPGPISGQAQHNPRWRFLEEVEMMPPDASHPDFWLTYSREATA